MIIIRGSSNIGASLKLPVLTMGNFDGVHLGHQRIFKEVVSRAKKIKGTSVVYTYSPHPVKIMAPKVAPKLLQTEGQKLAMIESLGLDVAVIETFTPEFAKLTAKEFFDEIVLKRICPKLIVIGYDFTFGVHRSGTVETLEKMAAKKGVEIVILDAMFLGETLLSSTQVRSYIAEGKMEEANLMLGRPYSLIGTVVKGRGIGGKIGYHTANMAVENELIPMTGVYVTGTFGQMSVTNIGYNPTFGGTTLTVETHIPGFSGDLNGKPMEVLFYKRIRGEKVFKDQDALKKQIDLDVVEARKFYEKI